MGQPPPPEPGNACLTRADLIFAGSIVALLGLFVLGLLLLRVITTVVLVAGALTYALLPAADWLSARKLPRWAAAGIVTVGGAGLIVGVLVLLIPIMTEQLEQLPQALLALSRQISEAPARLEEAVPRFLVRPLRRLLEAAPTALGELFGQLDFTAWVRGVAASLSLLASLLVFVPVFVFLMLRSYHPAMRWVERQIPPRFRPRIRERATEVDRVLSGFIRGQLLVAGIVGALFSIAYSLIGLPAALVVGVISGMAELVPYLGAAVALSLGLMLALVGGEPSQVYWVLGVFAVFQVLEGTVISPTIVGSKVRLGAGAVIAALAVGGKVLGLVGMLLAVPAAALLKVAAQAAIDAYRRSNFFERGRPARP